MRHVQLDAVEAALARAHRGGAVEKLYRSVRALRIYEGTTEIQKLIIGGALVAHAAEGAR